MENCGIIGPALLTKYLCCQQYVSYNNVNYQPSRLTNGEPQGSILGRILFLTFVNDIVRYTSLLYFLFLPMTNIYLGGDCPYNMVIAMNKEHMSQNGSNLTNWQ